MKKNNLETADANSFSVRYGRYCRELDKENGLINDRVRWLLVSQSILFAAAQFGGPSPFRDKTYVYFELYGWASLYIYDTSGAKVATVVEHQAYSGHHTIMWEPRDLKPAMYFYHFRFQSNTWGSPERTFKGKMIFLR